MANAKIKKVTVDGSVIVAKWEDGPETRFDVEDLNEEMTLKAAVHGVTQKVMDAHSAFGGEGVEVCRGITLEVWDRLLGGSWNAGKTFSLNRIIEALAEIIGKSVEEAKAYYDGETEENQAIIRSDKGLDVVVKQQTLARAKARAKDTTSGIADMFAAASKEA